MGHQKQGLPAWVNRRTQDNPRMNNHNRINAITHTKPENAEKKYFPIGRGKFQLFRAHASTRLFFLG